MKRIALFSTSLAALLVPAAATAQDTTAQGGISVTAPRAEQTGRTSSGIPIRTVSADAVVEYADLDLTTPAGAATLEARIESAARNTCEWLDELYPLANRVGPDDCVAEAIESADGQMNTALKLASAY